MRLTTLGSVLVVASLGFGGTALAQSQPAQQQMSDNGAFCLQAATGGMRCSFASMDACNKEKKGQNDVCIQNPSRGTTGAAPGQPKK